MTALAGVVYPDAYQSRDLLLPMLETLGHRGTGDFAAYSYRNAQIGTHGSPIWTNSRQTIRVAMDADIVNSQQLKAKLESDGYTLQGASAEELIGTAYEHWGIEFVEHLEGEFSIAILDQQQCCILLFRDRIGKRPLYWLHNSSHFLFGSELKALLSTGLVPQSPSPEGFAAYLYFGYLPQDITPIAKVNKLLPGHYLKYTLTGQPAIYSYWSCSDAFEHQVNDRAEVLVEKLDHLLTQSTRARLPESGHIAAWVSGGMGSAIATRYLSSTADDPSRITSYTATFHGQNDQDYQASHNVSEALGLSHRHQSLGTEDILRNLVSQVWYLDEPIGDPGLANVWHLASMTRADGLSTVFSGMGADELLGESQRYVKTSHPYPSLPRYLSQLAPGKRQALLAALHWLWPRLERKVRRHVRIDEKAWCFMQDSAVFPEHELAHVSPSLARFFEPEVFLQRFYRMVKIPTALATSQYFDLKTRLPDALLAPFDRIAAAHGLQWKTPFLDRELIEYLIGIAASATTEQENPTWHFRQSVRNWFPGTSLHRPKEVRDHFLLPWTRTEKVLGVFDLVRQGSLVEAGLISPEWLERHLKSPTLSPSAFHQLWMILILEIWFRLFINNPSRTKAPKIWVHELLRTRA